MAERGMQVAEHFENLERQSHAARLGTWVFLASEVLFFAGLFGLYAAYRAEQPSGFSLGVEHGALALGSINTCVLLASSYTVALGVHALRRGKRRASALLVGATIALGACFLVVKIAEYAKHIDEGIYPGGAGLFFQEHPDPGAKTFFTLYYCMTGLHALHVVAGMTVLSLLVARVVRRDIEAATSYPLALGAAYWHLVDVVWIFLWPLFYLAPGGRT